MEYKEVQLLWATSHKTETAAFQIYEVVKSDVKEGDICYTTVRGIGRVLFEVERVETPVPFTAGSILLHPVKGSTIALSTYGTHDDLIEGHRLLTDKDMVFSKKDCCVLIGRKFGPDNVLDIHSGVKNAQDVGQKWLDYYNSLDLV